MKNNKYDGLKLENQLCFPLYAASNLIIRRYKPLLDELNLTYTQYITMMCIWEAGEISVKELGDKLFLDSGTLTPLLKKLEQKGYIVRQRSKQDERSLIITLTKQGEELEEKALSVPQAISKCINLNADEAINLHKILYKILNEEDK